MNWQYYKVVKISLKKNIVGLEVEVEFASMYKGQPLFSDVDTFVREKLGLELWDIRRDYWKYEGNNYRTPLKGRIVFGDALYLRSIQSLEKWITSMDKQERVKKIHALLRVSIAYGLLDYALAIVKSSIFKEYSTKEDRQVFIHRINKSISKGFYPFKNGSKFLHRIFSAVANSFQPRSANSDRHLGFVKKSFWL